MPTQIAEKYRGKSILIVDDDNSVRVLLRAILSEHGYVVFEASNGKAACRHIIEHKTALMITDLIMPEEDGLESIQWTRKAVPEMKIIAISGAAEACYLRTAGLFGAHELLRKPFSCNELVEKVHRLLTSEVNPNESL